MEVTCGSDDGAYLGYHEKTDIAADTSTHHKYKQVYVLKMSEVHN